MDRNYNPYGYYNPSSGKKRKADEEISYVPTKKTNTRGQHLSNARCFNNRILDGRRGYRNNRWRGPYNRHNNFNTNNRLPTNVPYPGNDYGSSCSSTNTSECNDKTPSFSGNSPQCTQSLPQETRYSANNRLKLLRTELQKPANEDGVDPPTSTNILSSPPNTGFQERLFQPSARSFDGNSRNNSSSLSNRLNVHKSPKSLWYRPSDLELLEHHSFSSPQNVIATIKIEDDAEDILSESNSASQAINNNSISEEMEMDWCQTNEYNVINFLQDLRENVIRKNDPLESQTHRKISKELSKVERNETRVKQTYVVVDTNIFLLHLNVVEKLMQVKLNDVVSVYVHVPWTVMKELDVMKSGRTQHHEYMRIKAQKAIRFINHSLTKNLNLTGQSMMDFSRDDYSVASNDDDIVRCCRQILEKNNRAMLLSNDVNLRNKAMSSGIQAFSHNDIMENLNPFVNPSLCSTSSADEAQNSKKFKDAELQFSKILSDAIIKVFTAVYGDMWNTLALLKENPPWPLQACLSIIEHYWRSLFRLEMHSNCIDRVKQLKEMINDGITNLDKLLELGTGICNDFKDSFATCVDTITSGLNVLKNAQQ